MKSKIFTSILALACAVTMNAQNTLLDDFEGNGVGLNITYANMDTAAVVANPDATGINTSDSVLLLDRINVYGAGQNSLWGAIVYLTPAAAQGTQDFNRLFFKGYANIGAEFYVRIWTDSAQLIEDWGQPTQITADTWTQISLDLTGLNWNNIDSISLEYGDWTAATDTIVAVTGDGYLTYVDDVELGYYIPEIDDDSLETLIINYIDPLEAPLMDDNGVEDAAWDEAGAATVIGNSLDSLGPETTAGDISGNFKALWDDLNVYVIVKVTDDFPIDYTGANPWYNDGIEIFTDGMARNYNQGRVNIQQMQNRINLAREDYDVGSAAKTIFGADTIFWQIAPGGTYNIEMRIPFFYFYRPYVADSAAAMALVASKAVNGDSLGMELSIIDAGDVTAEVRENLLNWSNPLESDQAYTNSEYWGHLILAGKTAGKEIKNSNIKVYPNPARTVVSVTMTSLSRVEVYTLDGRVVAQQTAQNNRANVEVSSLANGMYIIKAIDANNMYTTSKFQKQQ